jgi:hypothetical protein
MNAKVSDTTPWKTVAFVTGAAMSAHAISHERKRLVFLPPKYRTNLLQIAKQHIARGHTIALYTLLRDVYVKVAKLIAVQLFRDNYIFVDLVGGRTS